MAIIGFNEIGAFKGVSGGPEVIDNPTSLQFGPDGRLYVSEQNGSINAFDVQVDANGQYIATAHEELLLSNGGGVVKSIMNHNDDGVKNPLLTNRQVTGFVVTGTAQNPVLYISSSDPRIATNQDSNLDTNSGILTKVTWNGSNWEAVDLIRGLPRSEENHSVNGMVLSEDGTKLYLTVGGNTNNGAPSEFFAYTGEFALSGTVLEIDLVDLESRPVLSDDDGGKIPDGSGDVNAVTRDYVYDLPTLDDPNIENVTDGVGEDANGLDEDGPFGGNDGLNMGILPADAPFRIFADGFRNNYDLVLRENGQLLTVDNGGNGNLGGNPLDENGVPTDESGLPPTNTPNNGGLGDPEPLFLIEEGGNFGHPAPARSNQTLAWTAFNDNAEPDPNLSVNSVPDLSALVPAGVDIQDGFIIDPSKFTGDPDRLLESGIRVPFGSSESKALVTIGSSSNGLTEFTSNVFDGALKGALLVAQFNGNVTLLNINDAGTALEPLIDPGDDEQLGTADDETIDSDGVFPLIGGFSVPLDVIEGPNGTIWVAEIGGDFIKVFAPTGPTPDDGDFDDDGILNIEDPFLRDATNGGSVVINAGEELLWDFDANQDDNLPGPDGYGGGLTGVMIDGETDFEAFFQEPSTLEGQDIKLDNVKFITAAGGGTTVVENVSNGDALETFNNGEYLFHTGLTLSPFVETLTVQWDMINPSTSFTGSFQQIGSYLGTGDQSNFLKLGTSQDEQGEIQILLEDNDVVLSESFIQADDLFTVPADQNSTLSFALEIDLINDQALPTIAYDASDGIKTVIGDSIDLAGTTVLDAIEGNYQVQSQPSGLALGLFSTNRGQDPADTFQAVFQGIEVTATGQEADLELAKTVDNNSPNIGDPVTFTLTLDNIGPDEATSVAVTDALPEGFSYISDTGNGTYDPDSGIWEIGSVPNGDSATLDITAQVVEAFESSVLYRVNAGGPLIEATDGNPNWSQDLASDNSPFLSNNGSNSTFGTDSAIAFNPSVPLGTPEAIFQQERWDNGSPNDGDEMEWAFDVDPGSEVEVRLYFAEIFEGITSADERVFDVAVEGVVPSAFDNIDPFAIAGFNTGFMLSDTFTIDDGTLNLEFLHNIENPAIKGIEILTTSTNLDSEAYINVAEISNSDQLDPDSTPSNSSTNEDDEASVAITPSFDNNDPATPTVSIVGGPLIVTEGNSVQVSLLTDVTVPSNETVEVTFQIVPGTATAQEDYAYQSTTASFDEQTGVYTDTVSIAGSSSDATFFIDALQDTLAEIDETFTVEIIDVSPNAEIGSTNSTSVTIEDDDNTANNIVAAINTGGAALTQDGINFVADDFFLNGKTFTDNNVGNGSQPKFDGTVYKTERYGNPLNYEIPVAPGNYIVELYFAEIFWSNQGNRVFDVTVEGELVLDDLDILAETEGDINQPIIFQVPNTISPETFGAANAIDIDFSASVDNGKISGIVVRSADETSSNTPPIATADNVMTDEDTLLTGSVFVDNGNGVDSDADGDPLTVSAVNGNAANVGTEITLASGALLTLNSEGSFSYDPNAQFESLNDGETDTDSFTYTISDGNGGTDTATVNVTIEGLTDDTPSENVGKATLSINLNSNDIQVSNFGNNSFQLTNTGNKNIDQVEIDVTNALYPDSVFDPFGLAGDTTSKALTINTSNTSGSTGIVAPNNDASDPNNQTYIGSGGTEGYKGIRLFFDESTDSGFNPGETLDFSVDMDPNSIAGSDDTEINNASDPSWDVGGISGAELINSTFTANFTDGSTASGQLQGVGNQGGSLGLASQDSPNSTVSLTVNNLNAGGVGTYDETGPSIIVNGTEGETARIVLTKGFIQPNPRNENYDSLSDDLKAQLDALAQADFPANNAAEFQTADIVLNGENQDISDQFDFSGIANEDFVGEDQLPLGFVANIINPDSNNLPLGPTTDPIYLTFDDGSTI